MTLMHREFTVYPTKIKGKERPRFRRVGKFVSTYTPKGTIDFESEIKDAYLEKYKECEAIDSPICVMIEILIETPKSWSKKKANEHMQKPHTQKPDIDNVVKCILDALNGIAYTDDSLINELHVIKSWSNINKINIKLLKKSLIS